MPNHETERLQKFMSRCGVASRRASEKLISSGRVTVNGSVVTKLGTKISPSKDVILVDGKKVFARADDVTIVLNKPAGYISTMKDPQNRPCVASLVPVSKFPSLFPVGRLDRLTRGLLIFTTNGDLGQKLLHPSHEVDKTYIAVIKGKMDNSSRQANLLRSGVEIQGGQTRPADIKVLRTFDFNQYQIIENNFFENCASDYDRDSLPKTSDLINSVFTEVEVKIHEGKNRQVRRMFAAVGYEVLLLERYRIGKLQLSHLEPGK